MLAFLNVTQVTTKHIKNSLFPHLKQLNRIQLFADAKLNVSARRFFFFFLLKPVQLKYFIKDHPWKII